MPGILTAIRQRIGPPRRSIPRADRSYFLTRPPLYLDPHDEIMEYYRKQELLLCEGQVGWGAIVIGDCRAFEPGAFDVPALIVHSSDREFEENPEYLFRIARKLY